VCSTHTRFRQNPLTAVKVLAVVGNFPQSPLKQN